MQDTCTMMQEWRALKVKVARTQFPPPIWDKWSRATKPFKLNIYTHLENLFSYQIKFWIKSVHRLTSFNNLTTSRWFSPPTTPMLANFKLYIIPVRRRQCQPLLDGWDDKQAIQTWLTVLIKAFDKTSHSICWNPCDHRKLKWSIFSSFSMQEAMIFIPAISLLAVRTLCVGG